MLQTQKSQQTRDSTWLSLLNSRYPCRPGAIAVMPTASAMHCTLAMASLHEIAMGRGVEFGVAAADTARVTEIELFDRNYGKPDGLYWIANVTVRGSETGLIVLFERTRQRITVTHGENWGIPK